MPAAAAPGVRGARMGPRPSHGARSEWELPMARIEWRMVAVACLLGALAGCGRYEIAFRVEDVINDGGRGDNAREQLDVDIIALTKADAEDFPELAEGTMWSQEWFTARDRNEQKLRKLDKRVYALRSGQRGPQDTLVGPPLVSARDTGVAEIVVRVRHPDVLSKESAFIIFGRFHDGQGGLKNTRPVIVRPLPPTWTKQIIIGVGRTEMTWLGTE